MQGGNLLVKCLDAQQSHAAWVNGGNGGGGVAHLEDGVKILGYRADMFDRWSFVLVVPLRDGQLVNFLQNVSRRHGGEVLFEVSVRSVRPGAPT